MSDLEIENMSFDIMSIICVFRKDSKETKILRCSLNLKKREMDP